MDLLSIDRGSVTAPAGCGKTQLIADALTRYQGTKPVLILTHTNAGVAALRGRLASAGVSSKRYRLATIDGWAMRLIGTFPSRSGHDPSLLSPDSPSLDYPGIRLAAARFLSTMHVSDILSASYAHLIVDEYQDCTDSQHDIVSNASEMLPTCVLGDPMQAIFDFGDNVLPRWNEDVCDFFPPSGELATPWRWINASSESLGDWLLDVRRDLSNGNSVDLDKAPPAVRWIQLTGKDDRRAQREAARFRLPGRVGSVLVIGDSKSPVGQRDIASQTPGAVTVEAVDMKDLVEFGRTFDITAQSAITHLVRYARRLMTNVRAPEFLRRIKTLTRGSARKPPSDAEKAALEFIESPSELTAISLLDRIKKQPDVRVYRPTILRALIKSLKLCSGSSDLTLHDAVIQAREDYRFGARRVSRRAVGSTLLLKGLEADVSVVLNADKLNRQNLYVAITRASKSIVICSRSSKLDPE